MAAAAAAPPPHGSGHSSTGGGGAPRPPWAREASTKAGNILLPTRGSKRTAATSTATTGGPTLLESQRRHEAIDRVFRRAAEEQQKQRQAQADADAVAEHGRASAATRLKEGLRRAVSGSGVQAAQPASVARDSTLSSDGSGGNRRWSLLSRSSAGGGSDAASTVSARSGFSWRSSSWWLGGGEAAAQLEPTLMPALEVQVAHGHFADWLAGARLSFVAKLGAAGASWCRASEAALVDEAGRATFRWTAIFPWRPEEVPPVLRLRLVRHRGVGGLVKEVLCKDEMVLDPGLALPQPGATGDEDPQVIARSIALHDVNARQDIVGSVTVRLQVRHLLGIEGRGERLGHHHRLRRRPAQRPSLPPLPPPPVSPPAQPPVSTLEAAAAAAASAIAAAGAAGAAPPQATPPSHQPSASTVVTKSAAADVFLSPAARSACGGSQVSRWCADNDSQATRSQLEGATPSRGVTPFSETPVRGATPLSTAMLSFATTLSATPRGDLPCPARQSTAVTCGSIVHALCLGVTPARRI